MNIPVTEMKDGQVGIITTWTISSYVGRIVQRHGSDLIAIGLPEEIKLKHKNSQKILQEFQK